MTAVDANILLYVHDPRDPVKQGLAHSLIQSIPDGVLLWQVAFEYLAASNKLARFGYSRAQAWDDLHHLEQLGAPHFRAGRCWTSRKLCLGDLVYRSGMRCLWLRVWMPGSFGFTGITIANTSRDVFGTTEEAGGCTLYYFGSTTGGGPAPAQQTTAVVPAGGQLVFTLSGGNATQNVAAAPGFQGYMIALCQFQHASGFAMITDGFGGTPQIATGYLAQAIGAFPGGRKPC